MTRQIAGDATAAQQFQEGGGGSGPIPKGRYLARILPKKGTSYIEVRAAAKQGPNAEKEVLNVRLELVENQPHAKRQVFKEVPLFQRWAPSGKPDAKYPDGAPAFDYFQFWGALGLQVGNPAGDTLPDDTAILGAVVGVSIDIRKREGYAAENTVSFFPASEHVPVASGPTASAPVTQTATPAWAPQGAAPAAPAAPAWAPGAAQAAPGAAPAAQQAWGVTPEQAQAAVPVPPQAAWAPTGQGSF